MGIESTTSRFYCHTLCHCWLMAYLTLISHTTATFIISGGDPSRPFTYIKSKRGNALLLYEGYTFSQKVNKSKNQCKKMWRCSTHTNRGCIAGLVTFENAIIYIKNSHNHAPVFTPAPAQEDEDQGTAATNPADYIYVSVQQ